MTSLPHDPSCDSGARCAVRDGMDVLILRCGCCGREVSVSDAELRSLRTIDCWMCVDRKKTSVVGDKRATVGRREHQKRR